MNSQSGWPVYVLLGTLSLLCLFAVRSMQPSPSLELKESDEWAHVDSIRSPKTAFGPPAPFTSADSRSPWNDSWSSHPGSATQLGSQLDKDDRGSRPVTAQPLQTQEAFSGGITAAYVVGQMAEGAHDVKMRALPPTFPWDQLIARWSHVRESARSTSKHWQRQLVASISQWAVTREQATAWLTRQIPRPNSAVTTAPIIVQAPIGSARAPQPARQSELASIASPAKELGLSYWHRWSQTVAQQTHRIRKIPSRLAGFQRAAFPQPSQDEPRAESAAPVVVEAFVIRSTSRTTWPYAEHLARRIDQLPQSSSIDAWAETTQQAIDHLSRAERLESVAVETHLFALQDQLAELDRLIAEIPTSQDPFQLRAVKYDLEKWISIWTLVHHAERQQYASTRPATAFASSTNRRIELLAAIDAVDRQLAAYPNREDWRAFFELDSLRSWADSEYSLNESIESIDRVLTRTEMARLSRSQKQLLQQPAFRELQLVLQQHSDPQVDLSELMYLLEVYEQKPWSIIGTKLLATSRRLNRSTNPYLNKLSEIIEIHYRNANVRIAISETLLNQMVPASPPMAEPVADQVLGANIFGSSQTTNQISLETVPDPRHVHLRLRADGIVSSSTRASKGLFVFHNRGLGHFAAHKDILVSPETLRVNPTQVTASNQNRTLGVESDLDLFPLIGPLARAVAMEKQNEVAPLARRIVERKLASKAQQRIDLEIDAKLDQAESNLNNKLFNPLDSLALALEPVNFATTDSRAIMRYRLAGSEQLSAYTSRPRAYANSVMSLQMHQSAINNCLQRLDLAGQEFKIADLYAHLSEVLGREIPTPADMDPSVELRFAPSECIEIRFEEGAARIILRFSELSVGRVSRWRNLVVEAEYRPRIEGRRIDFVRVPDSAIGLEGRNIGFRDQMAIRTIFNKVFDPNLSLGVTPDHLLTDARFANLEVSQFELRDGWVGLSVEAR